MADLYICRRCLQPFERAKPNGRAPHYCSTCKTPPPRARATSISGDHQKKDLAGLRLEAAQIIALRPHDRGEL